MAGRIAYLGNIVTQGLVLDLDAAKKESYPGTGTSWNDLSGNNINGTLINGPTYSTESAGTLVFDGVNDYVDTNSLAGNFISNPSLNSNILSFSCWVFVSSSSSYYIISSGGQTNSTGVAFSYQNGSPFVTVRGAETTVTQGINIANFPLNTWINFSFVSDGSTLKTYKDAVLVGNNSFTTGSYTDNSTVLSLGRPNNFTGGLTLGGKIAQVIFYNRAPSQAEVTQNFNAYRSRYGI